MSSIAMVEAYSPTAVIATGPAGIDDIDVDPLASLTSLVFVDVVVGTTRAGIFGGLSELGVVVVVLIRGVAIAVSAGVLCAEAAFTALMVVDKAEAEDIAYVDGNIRKRWTNLSDR